MAANPKKVLIFSTAYFPFVGGAEIAVKEITDRLPEVEFDMITARLRRDLPKTEKIGNVIVYRLGLGVPFLDKQLLPWLGTLKTLALLQRNEYDFFWAIMATFASGAAYLANIIRFYKPTPIILTLQEGVSERHLRFRWFGLINLSWRLALKRTLTVTVISKYLADRARRLGFKGEIVLLPNGVDLNLFSFSAPKNLREEIRLITTSRLSYKNGLDLVIKALPLLPVNVIFHIAGIGEEENSLKTLASDLGVAERVIWHGFISHEILPNFLQEGDIFIRPSRSEGLGNSFLEAMATGLPVVATSVGGITDFLIDRETGFSVLPEDPQSIANVVLLMIDKNNTVLVDKVRQNARRLVISKYTWDDVAKKMSQILISKK